MRRFDTGNVIKTKEGYIEIIYNIDDNGYTSTIPIDSTNCMIGHSDKTYQEKDECCCGERDCEYCNGETELVVTRYGMEDAVLIAPTVRGWIMQSVLKNFDFGR